MVSSRASLRTPGSLSSSTETCRFPQEKAAAENAVHTADKGDVVLLSPAAMPFLHYFWAVLGK